MYTNASTLSLVTKLTMGIAMFLIVASLTLYIDYGKLKNEIKPQTAITEVKK